MEGNNGEEHVLEDGNLTEGSTSSTVGISSYTTAVESLTPETDLEVPDISSVYYSARIQNMLERRSDQFASQAEADIDASRVTWSEMNMTADAEDEDEAESNRRTFLELRQRYRTFFKSSNRSVVLGERFASGGQADIYKGFVQWGDGSWHDNALAYKVFKLGNGNPLRLLQNSMPLGMISNTNGQTGCYFNGNIWGAFLLDDGRLAFKMQRQWGDLRRLIDVRKEANRNRGPPFSNFMAYCCMRDIARCMQRLHKDNIIHRDLKAANVLVDWPQTDPKEWANTDPTAWKSFRCQVVDMETSGTVIGTQFWRAPEILREVETASKEIRRVNARSSKLYTESVDVYGFAMTCYEIVTGRLPFEGLPFTDYEPVYSGRIRLEWPGSLEPEIKHLLQRCSHLQPLERPTFMEICRVLLRYVRYPFTW